MARSEFEGARELIARARAHPYLSAEDELRLARAVVEDGSASAERALLESHLRLVVKIAMKFTRYGQPLEDLVAEGSIGFVTAIRRFEPDRGFRVSTYASWYVRAAIQEYVVRGYSLVRVGSSATTKRLFFNLSRLKSEMGVDDERGMTPSVVDAIATKLGVRPDEVLSMNSRVSRDVSLSTPVRAEAEMTIEDTLVDGSPSQGDVVEGADESAYRRQILIDAMASTLNERERRIFSARRLLDEPQTLEILANEYDVSRERIRQIEMRALAKVSRRVLEDVAHDDCRTGFGT